MSYRQVDTVYGVVLPELTSLRFSKGRIPQNCDCNFAWLLIYPSPFNSIKTSLVVSSILSIIDEIVTWNTTKPVLVYGLLQLSKCCIHLSIHGEITSVNTCTGELRALDECMYEFT